MSLELCILGSGSSGNSTVVRTPRGVFLIDAGFGPRVTEQRLHGTGVRVEDISAMLLTHLDHDHFNTYWLRTILRRGIQVYCARKRLRELLDSPEARELEDFPLRSRMAGERRLEDLVKPFDATFEPVQGVQVEPILLAHDRSGSHGFLVQYNGYQVGFATDLGHVPEGLVERFSGVDVLALESNYDPDMELNSPRPWHLKQRIMGGQGHLSNEQAFAAVRAILDRTEQVHGVHRLPEHIVLLHRSRQCNCPKLVRRLFAEDSRIAPVLTLTHQHEPTRWLSARRDEGARRRVGGSEVQLAMAWR